MEDSRPVTRRVLDSAPAHLHRSRSHDSRPEGQDSDVEQTSTFHDAPVYPTIPVKQESFLESRPRAVPRTPPSIASPEQRVAPWDCALAEVWVQFPDHSFPVFGWYREGAHPTPDTFFGADGGHRLCSRASMEEHRVIQPSQQHLRFMLHPALQRPARAMLLDRDPLKLRRPLEARDWRDIIRPGYPTSLPYEFSCYECQQTRTVRRDILPQGPETLDRGYQFHCSDTGVPCHVLLAGQKLVFDPTQPIPSNVHSSPAPLRSSPVVTPDHELLPSRGSDNWMKKMKSWPGTVTYDGSPSLVQLRGWEASLKEAFEEVGVPLGRPQVLQGIQYLRGEAEKWWRSIAGQPQGQALRQFEELAAALQKRFIPRSAAAKALDDWASLRQTGTAEQYMRYVDELATVMPLGEVAEYSHALRGMRPEIRVEIEFRMEEAGKTSCGREELRKMMWLAETRYPYRPPRPFLPRPSPPPVSLRAAEPTRPAPTPTPPLLCWVCDSPTHRAAACPRRRTTGCARCGSRAHTLVICPQRPRPRAPSTASSHPPPGGRGKDRTRPPPK